MKRIKEDKCKEKVAEYGQEGFLNIHNLSVTYRSEGKKIKAVNGVSLQLRRGETLALVGETGAGKTTIAKAILQILPDRSVDLSGEIYFEGKNIVSMGEKEIRKIRGDKISMIFQDPMTALNPSMSIGRQIAETIQFHQNINRHEAEEKAISMLEMVGIPASRFHEFPHQFSGGMKQRVIIAIALSCNPQLLLADEPTTALDVTIQAQVLELIMKLKQEYNAAMILITHDLGVVNETCENVAVVYAGQIVERGTTKEIFTHPSHPYTCGLIGALPNMNIDASRLHPIPGLPPDPSALPSGCAFASRCPKATEACRKTSIEEIEISDGHYLRCIMLVDQ